MRILVTRPEPDGERTAEKLRARGFDVMLEPLLRVEPIAADLGAGPYGAAVITSANAVQAANLHPRRAELLSLPVFAVGRRTGEAARAAGFADVISADGDLTALVRLIKARDAERSEALLYLAGEDRSGDLAGDLAAAALAVFTAVVYRAVKVDRLSLALEAALARGEIDGVLHFSQRTAGVYLECARRAGLLDRAIAPFHYCLSQRVAEPLVAAGAAKIQVAPRPEEAALIDLVGAA